jgi:adenylate cyclase class 2
VRRVLEAAGAEFRGTDAQVDTYYAAPAGGRLKLRRGSIERSLVHYARADHAAVKRSDVTLARLEAAPTEAVDALHATLAAALGTVATVTKAREIRFVDNVKFHLDEVPGLGAFVEIEAIDLDGSRGEDRLRAQCEDWRIRLGIDVADLVAESYADLVSSTPGRST